MDSFYARDIQELFAVRNRAGFLKLLHLTLGQSGGLVDQTNLAKLCEISRPTIGTSLEAMRLSHAVYLLPPYHGEGRRELVHRPKAYAFDTGFVAFARGWDRIREEDRGILWEHLVLDTLRTAVDDRDLHFWRDKSGREVDFVVVKGHRRVDAIECKINPDRMDGDSLGPFRHLYPNGRNFVVGPFIKEPYEKRMGDLRLRFANLPAMVAGLGST